MNAILIVVLVLVTLLAIAAGLSLVGAVLKMIGAYCEKKALEHMTLEERLAYHFKQMADAIRRNK